MEWFIPKQTVFLLANLHYNHTIQVSFWSTDIINDACLFSLALSCGNKDFFLLHLSLPLKVSWNETHRKNFSVLLKHYNIGNIKVFFLRNNISFIREKWSGVCVKTHVRRKRSNRSEVGRNVGWRFSGVRSWREEKLGHARRELSEYLPFPHSASTELEQLRKHDT